MPILWGTSATDATISMSCANSSPPPKPITQRRDQYRQRSDVNWRRQHLDRRTPPRDRLCIAGDHRPTHDYRRRWFDRRRGHRCWLPLLQIQTRGPINPPSIKPADPPPENSDRPRSTEGLLDSTKRRKAATRAKDPKSVARDEKEGLPISINAVANYAHVARKTIYNHPDLKARSVPLPPHHHDQPPCRRYGHGHSSVTAALRDQLRSQKHSYEADITAPKAQIKQLQQELATAHGELHRLRTVSATPQRGTQ